MIIDFRKLEQMTSESFANFCWEQVRTQNQFREVMRFDCTEEDGAVVVDMLVGWDGKAQALWTFTFYPEDGAYDQSVVNSDQVARFFRFSQGGR